MKAIIWDTRGKQKNTEGQRGWAEPCRHRNEYRIQRDSLYQSFLQHSCKRCWLFRPPFCSWTKGVWNPEASLVRGQCLWSTMGTGQLLPAPPARFGSVRELGLAAARSSSFSRDARNLDVEFVKNYSVAQIRHFNGHHWCQCLPSELWTHTRLFLLPRSNLGAKCSQPGVEMLAGHGWRHHRCCSSCGSGSISLGKNMVEIRSTSSRGPLLFLSWILEWL